jgi:hypothetical protein
MRDSLLYPHHHEEGLEGRRVLDREKDGVTMF